MYKCYGVLPQPKKGEKAPDISFPMRKERASKLSSLKGKVVLIDFWASLVRPLPQGHARPAYQLCSAAWAPKRGFEMLWA